MIILEINNLTLILNPRLSNESKLFNIIQNPKI